MASTIVPGKKFSIADFVKCTSVPALETYLRTLEQPERIKFWAVPRSEWNFGLKVDWDAEEWPLRKVPREKATFSINDSADPTQPQEAVTLYKSIYKMLEKAKARAVAAEKPLRIIVGELHLSRSDLLVTNMITSIAKRLGIEKIGIEGGEEKQGIFPDFEEMRSQAEEHYKEHGNTAVMDETAPSYSAMPQYLVQNTAFQYQAAFDAAYAKEDIFDSSPLRDEEKIDYALKHMRTAEVLKQQSAANNNTLNILGAMHVSDVMDKLTGDDSAYTLVINTSQQPYSWVIDNPIFDYTKFADVKILEVSGNNAADLADNADGRFVQIIAPGEVTTAKDAFRLSRIAEKAFVTEQYREQGSPETKHGR